MKTLFAVFIIIALSFSTDANAAFKVVVYGDSLTSGYQLQPSEAYAAKLQQKLKDMGYQGLEVENMSAHGVTTAAALEGINKLLAARPDVVVLQLGTNDVLRGINPSLMHRNLASIIEQLLDRRVYIVLMGVKVQTGLTLEYAKHVDSIYYSLADRYGVPFYPNVLDSVANRRELTLADGFHANSKGMDAIVEATYRMVDAGLRWKYEVIQYQQQLRQSQQMNMEAISPVAPR